MRCKVRYVYGTRSSRSDVHKREGACAIPGEIWPGAARLAASKGDGMRGQKSAEGIVGGDTEGPNMEYRE